MKKEELGEYCHKALSHEEKARKYEEENNLIAAMVEYKTARNFYKKVGFNWKARLLKEKIDEMRPFVKYKKK
jgi:hypothetical protein